MVLALRAELRKLITVRSTYVTTLLAIAMIGFINFWVVGYKGLDTSMSNHFLQDAMLGSLSGIGILIGVVPILLVTHEYRYNTIFYSLAEARSRTKVFLAKWGIGLLYAVAFAVLIVGMTAAMAILGVHLGGRHLVAQNIVWQGIAWRGLMYSCGIASFGVLFAFIIRNQIGTFVTYLIAPGTVEAIAGLVLKKNVGYLPFTALNSLVTRATAEGFSTHKSVVIVATWIALTGVIAWVLFVRRDAN